MTTETAPVSAIFDPRKWRPVEGFDFTDVTYHKTTAGHGTVELSSIPLEDVRFDDIAGTVSLSWDTLDDRSFPTEGGAGGATWRRSLTDLGSDVPYEEVEHELITLPERVFNPEYERKVLAAEPLELLQVQEDQREQLTEKAAIPIEEAMRQVVQENGGGR